MLIFKDNTLELNTEAFTTQADATRYRKQFHDAIAKHLGVERSEYRLPNGLITLYGSTDGENFTPLTTTIGKYQHYIAGGTFKQFKLWAMVGFKREG